MVTLSKSNHLAEENMAKAVLLLRPRRTTSEDDEDHREKLNSDLILTMRSKLSENQIKQNIDDLLKAGANINAQNLRGKTVLHLAIEKGYVEVVKFLISNKAATNIADRDGVTASDLGKRSSIKDLVDIFSAGSSSGKRKNDNDDDDSNKKNKSDDKGDNSGKRKLDDPDEVERKRRKLLDNMEIPSGGSKSAQHGNIFQLKMLMLYLARGIVEKYPQFRLATELDEAGKFDDVVFQHLKDNVWLLRLIQAKHKEGETADSPLQKINEPNLLSLDEKEEFGIPKYFNSHLEILQRILENSIYSVFSKSEVEDILLVTNTDFSNDKIRDYFVLDSAYDIDKDPLLKVDKKKNPQWKNADVYKIKNPNNNPLVSKLKPIFEVNSQFYKLVEEVTECVQQGKQLEKTGIIKNYYYPLINEVFDIKAVPKQGGAEYHLEFKSDFLTGDNISEAAKKFRDGIIREIGFDKRKDEISTSADFGQGKLSGSDVELVAKKLAECVVKKKPLTTADFGSTQITIMNDIINRQTNKFRTKFISGKTDDANLKKLRDQLKSEIIKQGGKQITLKDMEGIEFTISQDFGVSTLPEDPVKLKKLAEALAGAIKNKAELKPSLSIEFQAYHIPLANEVISKDEKRFQESFVNGKMGKGATTKPLPPITKQFRNMLLNELVPIDNVNIEYVKKAKIKITKGFAEDFRPTADFKIEDVAKFSKELETLLSKSTNNVVEVNDKTVDKTFEANFQKIAGYVLTTKFKKIRFSSFFLGSNTLPGNFMDLKRALETNLGKTKFESLFNYEFDVKGIKFKTCEDGALFRNLPVLHNENNIQDFFDKFKLVVNYPNRKELSSLVVGELQNIFKDLDSRESHSLYLETMHDWMADRMGTFLTPSKASALFQDVTQQLKFREMEGITNFYLDRLFSDYEFTKNHDTIVNFLQGKQKQVLHLITDNVKLSSVKMAQMLMDIKQKPELANIKEYVWGLGLIFISLDQLSHTKSYITEDVLNCFRDKTRTNLLVLPSNNKQKDLQGLSSDILSIIENNPKKKIILITKQGNELANTISEAGTIKSQNKYLRQDDKNSLKDLTTESQKRLLDLEVNFQGRKVKLSQITGGDESLKALISSKILYEIMVNKEISIGSDLRSLGDIGEYYIPRTFIEEVQIEKRILYKSLPDFFVVHDLDRKLATDEDKNIFVFDKMDKAEQMFYAIHEDTTKPNANIHLLKLESGKLIWQRSLGSKSSLLQYRILTNRAAVLNENQLIESEGDRIMIISDKPGMGKSTVLIDLGLKLQEKYPGLWVMRINLLDYVDQLKNIKSINNLEEAMNFLLDTLSNVKDPQLRNNLEKSLFERSFANEGKIALLFDGFDEISPHYKEVVVQLLQQLHKSKVKKLFITTRLNMREVLEESLGRFSRMLEPFNKQNQKEFLTRYWQSKLGLSPEQLETYVNKAISDLFIINTTKEDFTGVPLQMRMIAEYFQSTIQEGREFPTTLRLADLYEGFIKQKYEIFSREKERKELENPALARGEEILYETYLKEHKQMALYALFNEKDLEVLISKGYMEKINKLMGTIQKYHERRGLISNIVNDKPHFIHRTIAEYFAAQYFLDELINQRKPQVQTFILTEILVQRDYKVIRAFLNEQLKVDYSAALGNELNTLWNSENRLSSLYNVYKENLLHVSAEEGNNKILSLILNSLKDHQQTQRELLVSKDNNGLPAAQTAAIYDQRETLEMFRNVYGFYGELKIEELRSQLFEQLKGDFNEAQKAREKLQLMASWCLPKFMFPGSRRRRNGEKCSFSWWDVDQISDTQTRDIEDVRIDSEKFLEYAKGITSDIKNKQLLELVQHIKSVDADRIIGRQKYLLDQVIADDGFRNFVQKERINELAGNTIRESASKMSPVLKNRLLNAAGKVHMTMNIYGVYSTIMTCKEGLATSCALSLGGIGYSVISQPIESALIKITPRVVSQAGKVGSKIIPKILGHDTKFLIKFGGLTYGTKVIKGVGGLLGGVFDIVDAAISTKALIDCDKRKNTNKPCGEKEIRDNIAGISFAAISFVTGIALLFAGSTFGVSVAVGFVIMAASIIYSGISNIIEYEKKYDTTGWENFRIFWHSVALQPMPEDVVHLGGRSDYVNSITQQAADQLRNMTENFVGYAFGLGKIIVNGADAKFERARSFIDLAKPNIKRYSLSRVQPKHIDDFQPICLPRKTGSNYEYNSESYDSHKSEYYCENGVTLMMEDRLERKVKNPTIFYDFTHIDSGYVAGNSSVSNIFYLKEGNPVVRGGEYTANNFIIAENTFSGAIKTDWNSTNIIDVSQLHNHTVSLSWRNQQPMYTYLDMKSRNQSLAGSDEKIVNIEKFQRESVICYKGGDKTLDNIHCTMEDVYMDHNLLVDAGGGLDDHNQDHLVGCTDAVIWPNTDVEAQKGKYTFYIKTEGYKAKKASSKIDVVGEGKIVFPELFLLKDCKEITYSSSDNTLSFTMPLDEDGTFTLYLKNYLKKDKSPNFILVDKLGSYIVPKIFDNKATLDMFEMYAVYSDTNELSAAVDHYDKLLISIISAKNYKVFGLVKFITGKELKKAMFGSYDGDIFVLDDNTIYARGNSGSDAYIVNNEAKWDSYDIDNYAKDLKLDVLGIFFKAEFDLAKVNERDLRLNVKDLTRGENKHIDVLRYFSGKEYRHLMVVDQESNSYIPFHSEETLQLVPFYHASDKRNVFIVTNATRAVIDCAFDNMSFYNRDDSLLISSKKLTDTSGPLSVILKFYYSENDKWKNVELYSYNKGSYQKIDLNKINLSGASTDDVYSQIIKEYVVDFGRKSTEIAHNQNGEESIYGEKEKIGVLIFKDIKPQHLEVVRSNDDVTFKDKETADEVVIKNWYKSHKYAMSVIEFDYGLGLEPIRIFLFDQNIDLKQKLNDAVELENVLMSIGDDLHKILKCTLAINSLQVTDSYRALGFTQFQQAATFIWNCDFPQFKLQHLRGIKIFLPAYYLQVYTLKIQLEGHDSNTSKRYRDIISDHFSDVLGAVNARIKIDIILEDEIRELDVETQKAVEYFLITSCSSYVGNNVLSETLKLKPSLKAFLEPKLFIKTMLLFMAKSYNDFLFKYPRVEKNTTLDIDYDNLKLLDITIVDRPKNNEMNNDAFANWKAFIEEKIEKITEALATDRFKTLLQGWDKNFKADLLKLVTISEEDVPFTVIKVEYKKKNRDNSSSTENLHREERHAPFDELIEEIDEVIELPIRSGASSCMQYSLINNVFKYLNPVNWFSKSIGGSVMASSVIRNNHIEDSGFISSDQYKWFDLNKDTTNFYSDSNEIPSSNASTNTFEFSSYNLNSTLLLMDVLTRKYTRESYLKDSKYYDYQKQIQKDEANCLAYNYYQ